MALIYVCGGRHYDACYVLSQRFRSRFKSYHSLVLALQAYDDKPHLVQNITCGLSFSLLNFVQVYQNATNFGCAVTLIITFSIGLYTLLACEFIHIAKGVKYHYNFVIQTYINLYVSLRRLWAQTQKNNLGSVSLTHTLMVLTLALVNTPGAFAMDEHSELTGLSGNRSSAGDCASMGLGNTEELSDKPHGEPVAEGAVKKAAKVAFDAAKVAAEKAKPHAEDMAHRVVETAKNT